MAIRNVSTRMFAWWATFDNKQCITGMNASCAIDHKAHSSAQILLDHECRITGHCDAYHTVLTSAMHVIQNYTELNLGWLPWFK
jgi:hypothetical protein